MFVANLSLVVILATAAAAVQAPPLQHPHESGQPPQNLGKVEFWNTCVPDVQADFNRAVALLHSFWFAESRNAFTAVALKDPSCGIAWWGVAMSWWGNPFAPSRPVTALEQGRAAIDRARAIGERSAFETAFVEAAAALFADFETVDHRTRTVNYERRMQELYDTFGNHDEAAAFYALAVNQTALPSDKSYTQQLKAARILEGLFERLPDHPGVAHYLIHAYDHPPLAERALPAARRYAQIAPDAPHALHMPSHTFTRVGHWEDSITTNLASAAAARAANSPAEVLHAYDYLVYAYLQTAQDTAAARVMRDMKGIVAAVNSAAQYGQVGYYAEASIPARYALERGAWREAAALPARSTNLSFIDAITHFARAVGAARSGNATAAQADAQKLAELRGVLLKNKDEYWAQQVEIQENAARAWIAFAERRTEDALRLMEEAVRVEESTDKSAISPGPLAPAREMLGEMLVELDRPVDALVQFEAVMTKEPNRFRTLYHAARAASLAADRDIAPNYLHAKAQLYYKQLVDLCAKGDVNGRPELAEARKRAGS